MEQPKSIHRQPSARRAKVGRDPRDWPIFYKILIGMVAVVVLALGITTWINVNTIRAELRDTIGVQFETLAIAQTRHVANILSEQLAILRNITLIDSVKIGVATASVRYPQDDQATIETQLLATDQQWQAAADDSWLVWTIVDPRLNRLTVQLLEYQEASPNHVEIFLTDRYGGLVAATNRTSDYYQADEAWWQAAYNEGQGAFYIGQPEYDESADYYALKMALPILSEKDEVIGIIRTTFRMDAINQAIGKLQLGQTGHTTLIDASGLIIADKHPEHIGKQMPFWWSKLERSQGEGGDLKDTGWHEGENEEGSPALIGHAALSSVEVKGEAESAAIDGLGWVVLVHQGQGEAYAPVASAARMGSLAAVTFALVAASLAFVVARIVVTPIIELAGVAQEVAAGDLSVRVPVDRHDETGQLAEAFNRMAEEITGMIETLEQRVAERTRELEQRSFYMEASAEVGRAASSILDVEQLIWQVVELIRKRFGLYYVGLFQVDETKQSAVLRAGTGEAGRKMLARGHEIKVGEGMIGWSVANAQARIALMAEEDAVRLATSELPDTRSEAALPLRSRGQVIGALTVQSERPGAFDEETITVLQTMADQVAVAMDNARLFAESQEALQAMSHAYGELSRQAWEEMLRGQTGLGYQADASGVSRLERTSPETWEVEARRARQTAASAEESLLALPIQVRGQKIGILDACKPGETGQWTREEISLLKTLVDQLGLALDSARLYQNTQRQATREQLINEITARLRGSTTVNAILNRTVEELGRTFGAVRTSIRLEIADSE